MAFAFAVGSSFVFHNLRPEGIRISRSSLGYTGQVWIQKSLQDVGQVFLLLLVGGGGDPYKKFDLRL